MPDTNELSRTRNHNSIREESFRATGWNTGAIIIMLGIWRLLVNHSLDPEDQSSDITSVLSIFLGLQFLLASKYLLLPDTQPNVPLISNNQEENFIQQNELSQIRNHNPIRGEFFRSRARNSGAAITVVALLKILANYTLDLEDPSSDTISFLAISFGITLLLVSKYILLPDAPDVPLISNNQEENFTKQKEKKFKGAQIKVKFFSKALQGFGELSLLHNLIILTVKKNITLDSKLVKLNFEKLYLLIKEFFEANEIKSEISQHSISRMLIFSRTECDDDTAFKINKQIYRKLTIVELHNNGPIILLINKKLSLAKERQAELKKNISLISGRINNLKISLPTFGLGNTDFISQIHDFEKEVPHISSDFDNVDSNITLLEKTTTISSTQSELKDILDTIKPLLKKLKEKVDTLNKIKSGLDSIINSINSSSIKLRKLNAATSEIKNTQIRFWKFEQKIQKMASKYPSQYTENSHSAPTGNVNNNSVNINQPLPKIKIIYKGSWNDKPQVNLYKKRITEISQALLDLSDPFNKGANFSENYTKSYINNLRHYFIHVHLAIKYYDEKFIQDGEIADYNSIGIMRNIAKHAGDVLSGTYDFHNQNEILDAIKKLNLIGKHIATSLVNFPDDHNNQQAPNFFFKVSPFYQTIKGFRNLLINKKHEDLTSRKINKIQSDMLSYINELSNNANTKQQVRFYMRAIDICLQDFYLALKPYNLINLLSDFNEPAIVFLQQEENQLLNSIENLDTNNLLRLIKKIAGNWTHDNYQFEIENPKVIVAIANKIIENIPFFIDQLSDNEKSENLENPPSSKI